MICLKDDDFTQSKFLNESRWEAYLSDGTIALQDDDREGIEDSAWIRLKQYLKDTNLKINNLSLRFRDNVIYPVPPNSAGYMLRRGVLSTLHQQDTRKLIIVGHLDLVENKILAQTWFSPELIRFSSEWRDINSEREVGESLILN